jgi:tetratricopeptide (TPR) repeat protein
MVAGALTARADIGNLLRSAHEANARHPECARRLARYLFNIDALEELVQRLSRFLDDPEADPECLHFFGLAASMLGDHALAERALSRAVSGGHAGSLGPWVKALDALNRKAEAYSAGMRTLESFPDDDQAGQVVFSLLLADERYAELWDLCLRLRAGGKWTARMVSAMALAARTPDQIALVRRMTDRDTWLEHAALDLETGFSAELSARLKESNVWTSFPRTKATVGSGKRIEKIHTFLDDPFLAKLFAAIDAAVADYVRKRANLFAAAASADNPVMAMRPEHPNLVSWVIAGNKDGHEGWHIHPDGWLSGVFYLQVPDLLRSDAPYAGQVEFGPYPLGPAASESAWPRWRVQPRTGDLMLFPSYFAHRTWPTHLEEDRICIAFDVLRQGVESPRRSAAPNLSPPAIGLDDRLVRHVRAISAADGADSHLIMNIDSGEYLALDETGALMWTLLQEPCTTKELTAILLREFDASEAEIESDTLRLLSVMVSSGLVSVL